MLWPTLKDHAKLKKAGMVAVLTAGILLSLNIVGMISVLGPQLYGMLNYPLLSTIRMASVADFLERIDAVVIMLMVAGGFFKVGVYIYGAAVGTAHLSISFEELSLHSYSACSDYRPSWLYHDKNKCRALSNRIKI